MEPLDAAILRTVLYADVFNFPMTPREIHHFLIHDSPTTLEDVEQALAASPVLQQRLVQRAGYVAAAHRQEIITLRQTREQASARLMPLACRYGAWLARLPFVRMVALTGALAMRNASGDDDDLDYMLVTAPDRVWLARAFSILLVRLARLRGVEICPNYVLDETSLLQDRQDLFGAHEVTQMALLYGGDLHARFLALNGWARRYLPNAVTSFHAPQETPVSGLWAVLKSGLERLLAGRLGDSMENWERARKLRRFARDLETPHSAARLDQHTVKGHFHDHGYRVLAEYAERLRRHEIDAPVAVPAGD